MSVAIEELYQGVASSDGLDRVRPLEAILDQSQAVGGLQALPDSRDTFARNPELIRRMKKRLFLLGYLKKNSQAARLSDKDERAIRRFQREANITEDGWVGEESWQVMEELFSFEADSHIERWLGNKEARPVLERAVQLRLFSFGLLADGPSKRRIDPRLGLERFVGLMIRLGELAETETAEFSFTNLHLLFDQARITRCVYRAALTHDLSKDARLKAFAVCTAKIELWLLGYPILPDGKGTYKRPARRRRKGKSVIRANRYQTFHRVLDLFCDDVNPGRPRAGRLVARKFNQQCALFFEEFVQAQSNSPVVASEPDTELLVDTIRNHPVEAQEEWEQQRSFGGRLWDGVKRAWGFLKRLFKRVAGMVTLLVRNAVRVIWSLAVHSIGLVKAAIRSFPSAVRYFLRPEVKGSDGSAVVFQHDTDFDWRVYVAPAPRREAVEAVIQQLREQVIRFTFSVRVVGLLMRALFGSLRLAPTGFLAVFLSIARIQPLLDPFLEYYQTHKATLLGSTS